MDICHEDILRSPEYFGQFGKPVKVQQPHAGGLLVPACAMLSCDQAEPYMISGLGPSDVGNARTKLCQAGVGEPHYADGAGAHEERRERQCVRHLQAAAGCSALRGDG